jgi:MFS family permease
MNLITRFRFGVRICLLVFTSLIALGQVIFAFGVSIKSWPVVFLGRLVFGFGGESLCAEITHPHSLVHNVPCC